MAYAEKATPTTEKATPTTKITSIQSLVRDFDGLLERVFKLGRELDITGDRLEGTRPQEAGEGMADTAPHSLTDELRRKYNDFNRALSQCEMASTRIDNALGYGEPQQSNALGYGPKPSTSRLG